MNGTIPRMIYADFWTRFLASLIDVIILEISFSIFFAIGALLTIDSRIIDIVLIVVPWLYFALLESSTKQATVGKGLVGIVVTDLSGNRISFGRATVRHFARITLFLTLMIGFLMAAYTKKKQALHDLLSSCLVVEKNRGYSGAMDTDNSPDSHEGLVYDSEKSAYDLSSEFNEVQAGSSLKSRSALDSVSSPD